MPFDTKYTKGFTLLELLVVIAIIGVLSAVVLASLNSSREKASNSAILSQMNEYQKALELYYSDTGVYPHNWSNALRARVLCLGDGVGTTDCLGNVSYGTNVQDGWNTSIEQHFRGIYHNCHGTNSDLFLPQRTVVAHLRDQTLLGIHQLITALKINTVSGFCLMVLMKTVETPLALMELLVRQMTLHSVV